MCKNIIECKKESLQMSPSLGAASEWRQAQMSLLSCSLSSFPGGDPGGKH